jgi:hypothetical protein
MFRTNTSNEYFEEMDGSEEGSDFLSNDKSSNSINKNLIDKNTISKKIQNNDVRSKLLSQDNMKIITQTKRHMCYLICVISISIITGIILFAIYNLTNGKKILFNYSKICFVVALCLTCCLCSCIKYKHEIEKINIPLISV